MMYMIWLYNFCILFFINFISIQGQTLQDIYKIFFNKAGRGIEEFTKEHLREPLKDVKSVFYPFGGADVTYPLILIPSATRITLVGMEHVGDLEKLKIENIGDNFLEHVDSLWRRSFFITKQMATQFKKEQGGVVPVIIAQLKTIGASDIHFKRIKKPINGVVIRFKFNDVAKRVYYFKLNLADNQLPKSFLDYLEKYKAVDLTMIKASSYMPHRDFFNDLKNFVFTKTQFILQDDSGFILREIKRHFPVVKIFGDYKKPYGVEWQGYTQKDLQDFHKNTPNKSIIPFCFGYGCRAQGVHANIILAQKKSSY